MGTRYSPDFELNGGRGECNLFKEEGKKGDVYMKKDPLANHLIDGLVISHFILYSIDRPYIPSPNTIDVSASIRVLTHVHHCQVRLMSLRKSSIIILKY